jgi:RNA polymerase sigma factor (sigma-70 family)
MTGDNVSYLIRHLRQLAAQAEVDLTDGELLTRFCRRGEETAFALLVQRHGPMVLSVCRRVAENVDDAEDAFQATFLVLARRATSIQKQSSLASWLYGVARRVAAHSRARAARRRTQERRSLPMPRPEPCDELTWQELRGVLDDELGRLPDKYRAPVVLCYLEGKSQDQAARELGCPRTSLSSRLARARELLHDRLVRRGIALSAAALVGALTEKAAAVPLPALLTIQTVRTATLARVGVSANVAALAKEGAKGMLATTTKLGGMLFVGVSLLLAAGYLLAVPGPTPPAAVPAEETAEEEPAPQDAPKSGESQAPAGARAFAGVVVDAADRPVARADVWLTTTSLGDHHPDTLDHARTDAGGRFRLALPTRWLDTVHGLRQELGLIAAGPGSRVAAVGFSRSAIPPATGARLVLGPAAEAPVQILAPDGKPVTGARVEVRGLACDQIWTDISEEYARDLGQQLKVKARATPVGFAIGRIVAPVPEELSRRLRAQTDEKGNATLAGVTRADIGSVAVTADAFGTQTLTLNLDARYTQKDGPLTELPATLTLQPAGSLSGRLTAKSAEALKGVKVRVQSQDNAPGEHDVYWVGSAEAAPGADGTFEVAALARGTLNLQFFHSSDATVRVRRLKSTFQVKAGARTEVAIPLEPAVRITGVVRERGTGRPVPGIGILIDAGQNAEFATTDANGRYTCLVPPGEHYRLPLLPRQFLPITPRGDRSNIVDVPEGTGEREVRAIEVIRALAVRGSVVDEAGKPAAGAVVRAVWWGPNQQFTSGNGWWNEKAVTADERGEFAVEGLPADAEVRLTARRGGALTPTATQARPDVSRPVTLRITKDAALALSGRVRDTAGRPVAGAQVEVWRRPWAPPPNEGKPGRVALEGPIRTDDAGKFQTPGGFDPDGEYRVLVTADGFQVGRGPWTAATAARPLALSDLMLLRLRTVTGHVLDRQGKPVAGVRVLSLDESRRITATTDAEGRFRLEGVLEGPAYLFADGAGFRFGGQALPADDKPLDLALTRTGEPVEKVMRPLEPAVARKERRDLAARILEPGLAVKDASSRMRALEVLALLDPPRVLDRLEKNAITQDFFKEYLRRAVAKALAGDSFDEARTVVEAMRDPFWRSTGYCDLCDALSDGKREQKREMLAQSLVHARATADAWQRIVALARIAKRLRQLGDAERAGKLLREAEPAARQLPATEIAGYARATFAEELAVIDLPAALVLVKDLKDPMEYDRHHGNIAIKLAAAHPADAERVLGMLRTPGEILQGVGSRPAAVSYARDQDGVRVCYRMAPADEERAKRIASRITDPGYRAQAYGIMALALARAKKPARATELLHQAFTVLADHVSGGQDQPKSLLPAPVMAASLLFVAEEIDPSLVGEFFWRTLALRTLPPAEAPAWSAAEMPDLPLLLARYDRTAARTLLESMERRAPFTEERYGSFGRTLLPALAAVDPKWAVRVLDRLPAGSHKEMQRLTLARALALDGEAHRRFVYQQCGLCWVDDDEDDL